MDPPDFTDFDESLAVALRAARTDTESSLSMGDFLYSTAATKDNVPFYRSYEAAASWLESDPDALQEGQRGVRFADRATVVASLRRQQQGVDIREGLVSAASATSLFAGVAR